VARELDAIIARRGKPELIIADHGTEFTSNAMLPGAQSSRTAWHFIAPAKTDAERHLRGVQWPWRFAAWRENLARSARTQPSNSATRERSFLGAQPSAWRLTSH
jgi:hypothetical protein